MPKVTKVSAKPILDRLPRKRGAKSAFAVKLKMEPAALTNWIQRGVSYAMLPRVCHALGITVDDYLREAGVSASTIPSAPVLSEAGRNTSQTYHDLGKVWHMLKPKMQELIVEMAREASEDVAVEASKAVETMRRRHTDKVN